MPTPNEGMREEARRGLDWRSEYNRGGTAVGVARARDIANGRDLSIDTVRRMRSFFARHEVDKQAKGFRPGEEGYPSAGRIAWALWGGDPGQSWANRILRSEDRQTMKVPRTALNISPAEDSKFELLAREEQDKRMKFRMVANSGGVIPNHPHWGNFAIDLNGLNIGRVRKPALRDHDPQRIVGHTYSIEVTDEGLVAEGTFSDTNDGREVMAMLSDGFPWQASVYVPPQSIEKLDEGETAKVNGRTIQGPGHVFRQSSLREVTFTSLGADENTGAAALSEVTIDAVVTAAPKETEVFMEDHISEVVDEATAQLSDEAEESTVAKFDEGVESGTTTERDRVNAFLSSALPDQSGLVQQLIADGVSKEDGLMKLMNDVRESMSEKLAHKLNATPEPVGPLEEQAVDPREQFTADKELVAQFGTFEVYEAYTRAVESGAVKGAK